MMHKFLTAILTFVCVAVAAKGLDRQPTADSIESVLNRETDTAKRLKLTYDLFDLQDNDLSRRVVGERLYDAAMAVRDTAAIFDALRLRAYASANNDSLLLAIQRTAELMPITREQKETVTIIRLLRILEKSRRLEGKERLDELHRSIMAFDMDKKVDIYRRIELPYTICCFLQNHTSSALLVEKLDTLRELINRLPEGPSGVKTAFYLRSSVANTYSLNYEKALKDSRELLKLLDEAERASADNGRIYQNNDLELYNIYRRMLANYKAMSREEIEETKAKIDELRHRNEEVARSYDELQVVPAYYAMARGEYRQAIPFLKRALDDNRNQIRRYILSTMYVEAANALNDKAALADAYRYYVPALQNIVEVSDGERVIENLIQRDVASLGIVNDMRSTEALLNEMEEDNHDMVWRYVMIVVMIFLIMGAGMAYNHKRALNKQLKKSNEVLKIERDNLRKSHQELVAARDKAREAENQKQDFISTISHELSEPVEAILGYTQLIVDSVDGKRRKYLDKFVDVVELNAQLLKTLVNDVLDVAELENSSVTLKIKNVSLLSVCEIAGRSIEKRIQPEVRFVIEPIREEDRDAAFDTDPVRLEQVVVNLLSNAFKFTEKGTVRLRYGIDHEERKAVFIVEDNGPGIPEGKEDDIFNRFEKLSHYNQGIGLGLHICRLVARLLGGNVYLDKTYKDGARFVFEQPLDI